MSSTLWRRRYFPHLRLVNARVRRAWQADLQFHVQLYDMFTWLSRVRVPEHHRVYGTAYRQAALRAMQHFRDEDDTQSLSGLHVNGKIFTKSVLGGK